MNSRTLKIISCLLALVVCYSSKEQSIDTLKLLKHFPVKNGYILKKDYQPMMHYHNQSEIVTIFEKNSTNDSVFSISTGEVIAKNIFDSVRVCIIKSGNYLYLYSLLNCDLKKGDFIKEGDFVGNLNTNEHGQKYVDMQISYKGKIFNLNEAIKILCD